jgi:hypothetical protein
VTGQPKSDASHVTFRRSFTRGRSLVRSQPRPSRKELQDGGFERSSRAYANSGSRFGLACTRASASSCTGRSEGLRCTSDAGCKAGAAGSSSRVRRPSRVGVVQAAQAAGLRNVWFRPLGVLPAFLGFSQAHRPWGQTRRRTATRSGRRTRGGTMPVYLTRVGYTPETWARLITNPEDRRRAPVGSGSRPPRHAAWTSLRVSEPTCTTKRFARRSVLRRTHLQEMRRPRSAVAARRRRGVPNEPRRRAALERLRSLAAPRSSRWGRCLAPGAPGPRPGSRTRLPAGG